LLHHNKTLQKIKEEKGRPLVGDQTAARTGG